MDSAIDHCLDDLRKAFEDIDHWIHVPVFEFLVNIPEGNENALYDLADRYNQAAALHAGHAQDLSGHINDLYTSWSGDGAAQAAQSGVQQYMQQLNLTTEAFQDMQKLVSQGAQDIEATKYMAILNLVMLLITLIQVIMTLWCTFGATAAEGAGAIALTREALATALEQLIKKLGSITVRGLLKLAVKRGLQFAVFTAASKGGIYLIQSAEGHNPTWDWKSFTGEMVDSFATGFIGGPLSFGLRGPLAESVAMAGGQFGDNLFRKYRSEALGDSQWAKDWGLYQDPSKINLMDGVAQAGLFGAVMGTEGMKDRMPELLGNAKANLDLARLGDLGKLDNVDPLIERPGAVDPLGTTGLSDVPAGQDALLGPARGDRSTGAPADGTTDVPADVSTGTPADLRTDTPADVRTGTPADARTGAPADVRPDAGTGARSDPPSGTADQGSGRDSTDPAGTGNRAVDEPTSGQGSDASGRPDGIPTADARGGDGGTDPAGGGHADARAGDTGTGGGTPADRGTDPTAGSNGHRDGTTDPGAGGNHTVSPDATGHSGADDAGGPGNRASDAGGTAGQDPGTANGHGAGDRAAGDAANGHGRDSTRFYEWRKRFEGRMGDAYDRHLTAGLLDGESKPPVQLTHDMLSQVLDHRPEDLNPFGRRLHGFIEQHFTEVREDGTQVVLDDAAIQSTLVDLGRVAEARGATPVRTDVADESAGRSPARADEASRPGDGASRDGDGAAGPRDDEPAQLHDDTARDDAARDDSARDDTARDGAAETWASAHASSGRSDPMEHGRSLFGEVLDREFGEGWDRASPDTLGRITRMVTRVLETPRNALADAHEGRMLRDFVVDKLSKAGENPMDRVPLDADAMRARLREFFPETERDPAGDPARPDHGDAVADRTATTPTDHRTSDHQAADGHPPDHRNADHQGPDHQGPDHQDAGGSTADVADRPTADRVRPRPVGPADVVTSDPITHTFLSREPRMDRPDRPGLIRTNVIERTRFEMEFDRFPVDELPGGIDSPEARAATHDAARMLVDEMHRHEIAAMRDWLVGDKRPDETEMVRIGQTATAVMLKDGTLVAASSVRETRLSTQTRPLRYGEEIPPDVGPADLPAHDVVGNRAVANALDGIPADQRSLFHGHCGEPTVLSKLANRLEEPYQRDYLERAGVASLADLPPDRLAEYHRDFDAYLRDRLGGGNIESHYSGGPDQGAEQLPCASDDLLIDSFGLRSEYVDRIGSQAYVDAERGVISLLPEDDPLRANATTLASAHPDWLVVVVHGKLGGDTFVATFGDQHVELGHVELARLIRGITADHEALAGRTKIVLLSCDSGSLFGRGDDRTTFADQLANRLSTEVVAPTATAWISDHGNVKVGEHPPNAIGPAVPVRSPDAPSDWIHSGPDGRVPLGDVDGLLGRNDDAVPDTPAERWDNASGTEPGDARTDAAGDRANAPADPGDRTDAPGQRTDAPGDHAAAPGDHADAATGPPPEHPSATDHRRDINWQPEFPKTLPDDHPLLTPTDQIHTPEREALRDKIVLDALGDARPVTDGDPVMYVMGGGGGAGKSAVLDWLEKAGEVPTDNLVHLDPDALKGKIPEYKQIIATRDSRAAAVVHEESSALAKRILGEAMSRRLNIVYDVTLGDPRKAIDLLQRIHDAGYKIHLYGVTVDADEAVFRNVSRAGKTGRYVPVDMQLSAHRGFSEGFEAYADIADYAALYDTNGSESRIIAMKPEGESLQVADPDRYASFEHKRDLNVHPTSEADLYRAPERIEPPATAPDRDQYVSGGMDNLARTSRTASGTVDTSASAGKADQMAAGLSGDRAASIATDNYRSVLNSLYEQRNAHFDSPAGLARFVEDVVKHVNSGITRDGVLYREHDSEKYPSYTRVADLPAAADRFFGELYRRLSDPSADPVETAAWVEYRMDLTDHLWADGCGKTAKAIAAWVLMRSGYPLPDYPALRADQFAHAPKLPSSAGPGIDDVQFRDWLRYYRSLFGAAS